MAARTHPLQPMLKAKPERWARRPAQGRVEKKANPELPIFLSSHLTPVDEQKISLPPGTELPAKPSGVSKYTRVQAALLSSIRLPVISAPYLISLRTVPLLSPDKLHKTLEYGYLLYLSLVYLST